MRVSMSDHRVGADRARLGGDAIQGEMAGGVENVAVFLDLAAAEALERAQDAAGDPDRIGDVVEHELLRRVAGIEQAEQVLTVAAGRERAELRAVGAAGDAGAHRQELDIALHAAQLAGDAGDGERAVLLRFVRHAPVGFHAAQADRLGDLGDLAAEQALQPGADAADEPDRLHAVADHDLAGAQALEPEAIDLVARESGHDRHGHLRSGRRAPGRSTPQRLANANYRQIENPNRV